MFHDLSFLEERIRHLETVFPSGTLHAVAMKANPLKRILEFLLPLGAGAEVAVGAATVSAVSVAGPAVLLVPKKNVAKARAWIHKHL